MSTAVTDILVLNGPNLDRLGKREPEVYGTVTLSEAMSAFENVAGGMDLTVDTFQSNAEHELIERIHAAGDAGTRFLIINPGGLTHTSVALRDAILSVSLPFIEVHLSNTAARDAFRHRSYFSDIAIGTITGMGASGYIMALHGAHNHLNQSSTNDQ
ncbi:MAG: type II 3-dehydroquinate dehydratase [Woeseiaceae bacterium]